MLKLILNNLFQELDFLNVEYCILRNYDELPDKMGRDLDFFVKRQDLPLIDTLIKNIVEEFSLILFHTTRFSYLKNYFLLCRNESIQFIQLDFFISIDYKGLLLIDEKRILKNRRRVKNFYVADHPVEILCSLYPRLFYGGFVREEYYPKIRETFENNPEKIKALMKSEIPSLIRKKIFEKIKISDETTPIFNFEKEIFLIISILRNPFKIIKILIFYLFNISVRLRNTVFFIAYPVSGNDDKDDLIQTLSDKTKSYIENIFVKSFIDKSINRKKWVDASHKFYCQGIINLLNYISPGVFWRSIKKRIYYKPVIIVIDTKFITSVHKLLSNLSHNTRKILTSVLPVPDRVFLMEDDRFNMNAAHYRELFQEHMNEGKIIPITMNMSIEQQCDTILYYTLNTRRNLFAKN